MYIFYENKCFWQETAERNIGKNSGRMIRVRRNTGDQCFYEVTDLLLINVF